MTYGLLGGILNKLSERTAVICKTKSKKTSKKVKKTLDKREALCYNNKAVAPEGGGEMYLEN